MPKEQSKFDRVITNLKNTKVNGSIPKTIAEKVTNYISEKKQKLEDKLYSKVDPKTREAIDQGIQSSNIGGMVVGKNATGWNSLEGKFSSLLDKKERALISDKFAKINKLKEGSSKLGDVLEHEELYKKYPELANIDVTIIKDKNSPAGTYNPQEDRIIINKASIDNRGTILHEIQHAIQEREDFSRGSNQSLFLKNKINPTGKEQADALKKYTLTQGEREARFTDKTSNLSQKQLKGVSPYMGLSHKEMISVTKEDLKNGKIDPQNWTNSDTLNKLTEENLVEAKFNASNRKPVDMSKWKMKESLPDIDIYMNKTGDHVEIPKGEDPEMYLRTMREVQKVRGEKGFIK